MLSSLESELNLGFLDDVSLGGPVGTVAADIARIAKEGGEMGLHLIASKCELIAHQQSVVTDELIGCTSVSWCRTGQVVERPL